MPVQGPAHRHRHGPYSTTSLDAADELITTPPRQPPPPALRRRPAAAPSPPPDEQHAGAGRAARLGGTGGDGGGVQMGFGRDWDPSAVLVCWPGAVTCRSH